MRLNSPHKTDIHVLLLESVLKNKIWIYHFEKNNSSRFFLYLSWPWDLRRKVMGFMTYTVGDTHTRRKENFKTYHWSCFCLWASTAHGKSFYNFVKYSFLHGRSISTSLIEWYQIFQMSTAFTKICAYYTAHGYSITYQVDCHNINYKVW